jgi:hypothetical protein
MTPMTAMSFMEFSYSVRPSSLLKDSLLPEDETRRNSTTVNGSPVAIGPRTVPRQGAHKPLLLLWLIEMAMFDWKGRCGFASRA